MTNLAAFGLVVGPAVVAGLWRLRDARLWVVTGAALGAVLAADLHGLSKGEVERIRLPFAPWLFGATAALPDHGIRAFLALQAVVALTVQTGVRTPW